MSELYRNKVEDANRLLESSIDQGTKKFVCELLEAYLFEIGKYSGFEYNWWIRAGGFKDWKEAGKPEGEAKRPFLIGPAGAENEDDDDFVDTVQGLYSRRYYFKDVKPADFIQAEFVVGRVDEV